MFINRVQNIRKERKFELTDRIFVRILNNTVLNTAIVKYKDYICAEILADELLFVDSLEDATDIEIDGNLLKVHIQKQD